MLIHERDRVINKLVIKGEKFCDLIEIRYN